MGTFIVLLQDYGNLNPSFFINLYVTICNFMALSITLKNAPTYQVLLLMFYGLAFKTASKLMTGIFDPKLIMLF